MCSGFDLWEITSNRLSNYKQKDHCHIRNMSLGKLVLHYALNCTSFQETHLQHILIESYQQAMKICITIYVKILCMKRG